MLIKKGLVYTEEGRFEELSILTDGDRISGLLPAQAMIKYAGEVFDASGCYVLPGLVDVHFHGCAGHDFCEGTTEALEKIAAYEFSQGVTGICPATMTLPEVKLIEILGNAKRYYDGICGSRDGKDLEHKPEGRARLLGIHLEGPFINPEKRGAQRLEDIKVPNKEMLVRFQEAAGGLIRLVTIAPEMEGGIACMKEYRARDPKVHFSIGHTLSDYDIAQAFFTAGGDHVTHLYNAMPPFTHRAPGVVGAAFDEPNCFVELICDGIHVSPSVVRATFQMFGEDRVVLISDSMEATGMPDGTYELGGQQVRVESACKPGEQQVNGGKDPSGGQYAEMRKAGKRLMKDVRRRATLADGTLAGSVTNLYESLKNAVAMGIPLENAVKAATINPCRSIGVDKEFGSISVGKAAKFLILDAKDLSIRKVIT